jgi:signal transduction histidine kinase
MAASIRLKLTLSYAALGVLTAAAIGLLSYALLSRSVERQRRQYLQDTAREVAEQLGPVFAARADEGELRELAQVAGFLGRVRVRVLDGQKKLLADSGEPLPAQQWARGYRSILQGRGLMGPGPQGIVQPRPQRVLPRRLPAAGGQGGSAAAVPIEVQGRVVGFVQLSGYQDQQRETLGVARRALILAALGTTLLAVLLGLLMSRRLTAPLARLSRTVEAMGAGDLQVRAPELGGDEIGRLGRQFNRMADRLAQSFGALARERDTLRQFVADASHELRTPITALRTFHELLRSEQGRRAGMRREFLRESWKQVLRLERMVRNLLDLSRLEAGLAALKRRIVDPCGVVASAVASMQRELQRAEVTVRTECEGAPAGLFCDPERLEMALRNLLDNGRKFSPSGSSLGVQVREEAGRCLFTVTDEGPGIPEEELPLIFNRFYRGRAAHGPRAEEEPGSGLGLAIAKSVAEAHGGTLSVASRGRSRSRGPEGRGSRFTLSLPLEA